jgi:4-amino-4-deoxy-L-arabinose transferase-like glycosyltransferase
LIFFSAAESKLGTYIMPMFPACAILVGVFWGDVIDGTRTVSLRKWVIVPLGLSMVLNLIALGLFVVHPITEWNQKYGVDLGRVNLLTFLLSFLSVLAFAFAWARRYRPTFVVVAAFPVVAILFFLYGITPSINPFRTSRDLAFQLDLYLHQGERMVFFGEEFDSAYFYTGRQAILLEDPDELVALMADAETVYCILDRRRMNELTVTPEPMFVLGREGHKVLVSNRPESAN